MFSAGAAAVDTVINADGCVYVSTGGKAAGPLTLPSIAGIWDVNADGTDDVVLSDGLCG